MEELDSDAPQLNKADLYEMGLIGKTGSRERRRRLAVRLRLPERMGADGLLEALNTLLASGRLTPDILNAYCADDACQQDPGGKPE